MFAVAFPPRLAMKTRTRLLSWLPALLLGPVLALCSTLAQAEAPAEAAKALHLLDYIGADYPPTVRDGKVVDSGEYREQQEFSAVVPHLVHTPPPTAPPIAPPQPIPPPPHAHTASPLPFVFPSPPGPPSGHVNRWGKKGEGDGEGRERKSKKKLKRAWVLVI